MSTGHQPKHPPGGTPPPGWTPNPGGSALSEVAALEQVVVPHIRALTARLELLEKRLNAHLAERADDEGTP